MSTKLRSVQSLATQTLKDSTDSYNLALNIYQQALAMQVPTVDNRELEDKARKVKMRIVLRFIRGNYFNNVRIQDPILKDFQKFF